jgi:mRNA interferase MazF
MVERFEIYLTDLEPTLGSEIKKVRPCVIISSNELNKMYRTVLIAPLTRTFKYYPTRVKINFQHTDGYVALDQIRSIDKLRLKKKIGKLARNSQTQILQTLQEMFEE